MSILRMVRTPAPRRFLPSLTIHNMFKALNAQGTYVQGLVRRVQIGVDAFNMLMSFYEEMAHAQEDDSSSEEVLAIFDLCFYVNIVLSCSGGS